MKNQPEYLQTAAAARLLGVSAETIRAWERAGKLKAIRTVNGVRLFDRAVVEEHQRRRAGDVAK